MANWLKIEDAKISVFDRGFMHGDGIYEVAPFYKGKPFLLKEHLDRLQYCLNQISLDFDIPGVEDLSFEALERAGLTNSDAAVYMQVSRGMAPRTHFIPKDIQPTFLMYAFPANLEDFENKSWKVLISEDLRWHRCDIKTTSWLANTMANTKSYELGLNETILHRDEVITEGSHSSIFFVKGNKVYTHPEGPEILSGITRKFVIGLCKELGIEIIEKPFLLTEIGKADEVFCTGTTTQLMQVKEIFFEGRCIFSNSSKGEILKKLQSAFKEKTTKSLIEHCIDLFPELIIIRAETEFSFPCTVAHTNHHQSFRRTYI